MFTHRSKSLEAEGMEPHTHETVAQMRECEVDWDNQSAEAENARAEAEAERRYELWLEGGGAASERIAWEYDQERRIFDE
jgi:hypothetical protein